MQDSRGTVPEEAIEMVHKETCPHCKGNRYVEVKDPRGKSAHIRCPHCRGAGYRVRLTH